MITRPAAATLCRILILAVISLLMTLAGANAADMPTLLGQLDVQAPVISIAATPDGKRLAAQLQVTKDGPADIVIVDSADPTQPKLLGHIPLDKAGQVAISPDGKSLLVAIDNGKPQSRQMSEHRLATFDLTQPDHPKQVWQQTLTGFELTLAPDAAAYAYLGESSDPNRWQMIVAWPDHRHDPVFLPPELFDTVGPMHLAPGGLFVTSSYSGQIFVADLRHQPALIYSQQKTSMGMWRNDFITLLDSGYILAIDHRAPRIGVYAPRGDVPRVGRVDYSALPSAGEGYYFQSVASAGVMSLLSDRSGKIYQLDTTAPVKPALRQTWRLPHDSVPAAIDVNGHMFASQTKAGKNSIGIYDLNKLTTAPVDWKALQVAQAAALKIYAGKKAQGDDTEARTNFALNKFEEADPMLAIDAPVNGISGKAAAGILNDYGFLLTKNWRQWSSRYSSDDIAAILRRAITLDPDRALAYLNLADFLRGVLPKITDWSKKQALMAEVIADYKKYLALGGQSAEVSTYVSSDAAVSASPDICSAVVNYANAGRLAELISTIAADVPVKDRKLDFAFGDEGTAHYPAIYAFDAGDDTPVEKDAYASVDQSDVGAGDSLGLIVYRGEMHILHYLDAAHPLNSFALSGDKACGFGVEAVEQLNPKAAEPELCKAIHADHGPASINFDDKATIAPDDLAKKYDETTATGMKALDIANDGHPLNAARFEQSSTAGAGCEAVFFDLVDKDGAHFVQGPKADLLMALQQAEPSNRYPILPCENEPKFFAYRGKVYFETKPTEWPPVDSWHQYHRVSRITNGKVDEVCKFTFKTTVSK